jgi:hypothetical protein
MTDHIGFGTGRNSFEDVQRFRQAEIEAELASLRDELRDINIEIAKEKAARTTAGQVGSGVGAAAVGVGSFLLSRNLKLAKEAAKQGKKGGKYAGKAVYGFYDEKVSFGNSLSDLENDKKDIKAEIRFLERKLQDGF